MTLKDIAEMAGVSTMTVSNVINGKTSRVSQKTRDKINSIIEEYNYVPNMNARSLSNNSSHIIGVVIFLEDKDYASGYNYFENPYVSTMIGTIETELHKNGYFTMLQSVSRSSDILSLVKNWNVDGMILVFPTSAQNLEKLMDAANCPIATFDSNYSHPNLINVISDDSWTGASLCKVSVHFRGRFSSDDNVLVAYISYDNSCDVTDCNCRCIFIKAPVEICISFFDF